ncbi:hypothetical protein V2J09_004784 [Rumex salicifolius]
MALFKTKVAGTKAKDICKHICLPNFFRIEAEGRAGGIWVLWDDERVNLQIVNPQPHFIRTRVVVANRSFQITFAYAPPLVYTRRCFGASLDDDLARVNELIFTSGDFNCIVDISEREGGSRFLHNDSGKFVELINDRGLIDMEGSLGNSSGFYVAKRLGRILLDSSARILWSEAYVRHLPKFVLDHTPILLCLDPPMNSNRRRRSFRFEAS